MRKLTAFSLFILICCVSFAGAQETYFGKNKVQYRNFEWAYIQSDHFDIYFYDEEYELAKFSAEELEKAYAIISEQLNYFVARRIPIFIYNSHNDFRQTNIIWEEPSEGTLGFTEVFKNRIVVHFDGSYADFRHLLHHELSHAVAYDLIYGQFFKSIISSSRLFVIPLWLAEGYAEYTSNGGWAQRADMMVRDATINDYLQPLEYMGFLSYTEGFALVKYIADNYGIEKPGEIFKRGKALISIDKALKSSIGLDSKELYEKFSKEMKKRYWPDIATRAEPKEIAKQLTHHGKDGSNYNEKPVFSPDGKTIAMISNKNGYAEIFLISAIDGKEIARLVKGERNAGLESLRWYTSGISFSPDGENLVFVSKAGGEDALNLLRIRGEDIYLRRKFGLKSIISPAWSPDGATIAFTALKTARRDIYLYNLETDKLVQLTADRYDDADVSWYPDGSRLVFSSDRPHPDNGVAYGEDEFIYGHYNLHTIDAATGAIEPVPAGDGNNVEPAVSPDGSKIAFVSDRNGIQNVYVHYIDSVRTLAVTNVISSATSPSWSADNERIAFSSFFYGGYDVYVMNEIAPRGENGILLPTDFVMGEYDNPVEWARGSGITVPDPQETVAPVAEDVPVADPDFPAGPGSDSHWAQVVADTAEAAADADAEEGVEDETAVAEADSDDASADSTAGAVEATETGEEDEEEMYVYNAPVDDSSVFSPEGTIMTEEGAELFADAPSVDSLGGLDLDNTLPNGEYRVRKYKTKFTPDIIAGGLQYDTFFGFRGQTVFLFSDYLGDHQIIVSTDLVNTIDQSNLQAFYNYNRRRINLGIGLFHTKNYYINASDELFSDRFYGLVGSMSWPLSKFTRFDLDLATYFIDRRNYDDPDNAKKNVRISTGALSWTHDTVLWGITGPAKGRRFKVVAEAATPVFGAESIEYYAGEIDFRQYIALGRPFTFAFRFSGGFSDGAFPKNYYLGGNVNRIGSISVSNDVYSVENLYFSKVVAPLRGYDYYDLVGTRYGVTNLELRFPFIDYFIMRYPLRLGLSRVTGAFFLDMGAVWGDDATFKGATSVGGSRLVGIKSGFGFGARANLGFLVLRYDMAWRTDFNSVEAHTKHYFSLGADF